MDKKQSTASVSQSVSLKKTPQVARASSTLEVKKDKMDDNNDYDDMLQKKLDLQDEINGLSS